MRKPFVAGNWKMNKSVAEARQLVGDLILSLKRVPEVEAAVCPPFTALAPVSAMLEGTGIGLGAQNLYWEASGAYTGEVAPAMVAELCQYVIIGHSERRAYFGETDETVNKKVKIALANELKPIVCVGETLEENEAGQTEAVVSRQMQAGLAGLDAAAGAQLVIAYEPVWAIGTGKACDTAQANSIIRDVVRGSLTAAFGDEVAQGIRIQYGGSVKPGNAVDYFGMSDIDGALVGGASLQAEDFAAIVQAAVPE